LDGSYIAISNYSSHAGTNWMIGMGNTTEAIYNLSVEEDVAPLLNRKCNASRRARSRDKYIV